MSNGFSGEVAQYYLRYRRGYPSSVIDALVDGLGLSGADTIVDLGCGTGQLTLPLATRVRLAIGVDPEPDMLGHARTVAHRSALSNVEWVLGTADDLEAVSARYGPVNAITLANAIHLVDRARLFTAAKTVLRPGGGLAIIANGTPLWLQDVAWSRALRTFLERWQGRELINHCGTDADTRSAYRRELHALGYDTGEIRVDYTDVLDLDHIVGGVFSAMSDKLPTPGDRARFASELGQALADAAPYAEYVNVRALIAHIP